MKSTYDVSGMHCSSCVGKVEATLSGLPRVKSASVSLVPPQAVVESEGDHDLSAYNDALGSIGDYRLQPQPETNAPGIQPPAGAGAVSYTHLTLPTKRIV